MDVGTLDRIKAEWPDWEEWIGELWLRWPDVWARLRPLAKADRWPALRAEVADVRRAVRNEGRRLKTFTELDIEL